MPDRVLRDELWQSDRFLDLPTDACRLAFLRMLSEVDDFGNMEGGVKRLYRLLAGCTQIKSEAATAATITALIDADLVRGYQVDGRELFHIPRLRPHRQYIVRKMPASPWDDDVKLGKTQRIETRGLAKDQQNQQSNDKRSSDVVTTLHARSSDVAQGVGVGVRVGIGAEEKTKTARKRSAAAALVCVDALVSEGVDRQNAVDWLVARKAKDLPLTPTAWKQTQEEALKAGMTPAQAIKTAAGNGWAGFKASWVLGGGERAPASAPRPTRHAGFETKDYRSGVTADGHLT